VELFCGITPLCAGPQEKRFAAYIEGLANAAGNKDRSTLVFRELKSGDGDEVSRHEALPQHVQTHRIRFR
jgi:hypothetical protein